MDKRGSSHPLPEQLQEDIWIFVRDQIARYEERAGTKVAKFEIHVSDSGQLDVEVLATQSANDAAIDQGLEEAGLKGDVNRIDARERLVEDLEKNA